MHVLRETGDLAFCSERELRDQVALNLPRLEPGLRLYDEHGRSGIEFPAGAGLRIDILALDSSNNFVVCELKAGQGHAEAVGQILKYMNWVRLNLCQRNQKVRGLIICSEVSEGLQLACSGLPRLSVVRYEMSLRFDESPTYEASQSAKLAAWPTTITSAATTVSSSPRKATRRSSC